MRRILRVTVLLALTVLVQPARADTVELKNGTIVDGKYAGGTAATLRLETPQGIQTLATADVLALTFTGGASASPAATAVNAAPPAASAAVAPPTPPAPAAPVTVPAGTVLTIRMESSVSSKDPAGKKFTAKLIADLMAGASTVAKAGATVHGQVDQSKQAGRLAGKSQLAILTGVDVAGKMLPIMTTNFAEAGKGEFRKTARNVAGGALIGNAVDDDGGAGAGAAVGAGASLIKKGDSVTVPQGALLEFRLTQPVQTIAH